MPGEPVVEAERTPFERLFEELGGSGRVQVFRIVSDGKLYSGQLKITSEAELADDFFELLARQFGGGDYEVVGLRKEVKGERNIGRAPVSIDPSLFPPKKTALEKSRDGEGTPAAPVGPPLDPLALLGKVEEMIEARLRRIDERQAGKPAVAAPDATSAVTIQLLGSMLQRSDELVKTLITSRAAPAAAPDSAASAIGQIETWSKVLEKLGYSPPGTSGAAAAEDDPKRSIGERVLLRVADKAADRVGDKIAEMFKTESAAPTPAPAAPAQQLAAPAPTPAPTKPAPQLPAGAIPIVSEDQLAKIRAASRRGQSAPPATAVPEK